MRTILQKKSRVILSPSAPVILSEAKNLGASRVNSAKDLLDSSASVIGLRMTLLLVGVNLFFILPFSGFAGNEIKEPQKAPLSTPAEKSTDSKTNTDLESRKEQIQQILKMTEIVKVKNQEQAREVRRIAEQTRLDQQILSQSGPPPQAKDYTTDQAAELLRQEKIRLIQAQSLQNLNAIHNLNPPPVVSKPSAEENKPK